MLPLLMICACYLVSFFACLFDATYLREWRERVKQSLRAKWSRITSGSVPIRADKSPKVVEPCAIMGAQTEPALGMQAQIVLSIATFIVLVSASTEGFTNKISFHARDT